ncbi:putative casein Kinase 2 substrate [Rosa chinensis]|uniref:Putative casein Kinase 2 substrate n=3 Tax=Rosa chinensis TaxID=74649 RepID=A0A2P6RE01_ROSCH|nr:putative casein Kinase 2 substrate [Rosa chinensis]
MSLGRIHRDGRHMIKGGSSQLSTKQLQQRVGVKPTLADCLDGLMLLQDMHCSDTSDLSSLQQILIDQPNIPREEVQFVFDIIFAQENC